MQWKYKSIIQNAISRLPESLSNASYYWIQRHFGELKKVDPVLPLIGGIRIGRLIREQGCDPAGKSFLEVGTGRVPLIPLVYWLMGAESTITIDLNPYLRPELLKECLQFLSEHDEEILKLFDNMIDTKRLDSLLRFYKDTFFSTDSFLRFCQIKYVAPGNAANTGLNDHSIDFHTSHAVFEHIAPKELKKILEEGNRIIKKDGLFIHIIDYSDHFSHSDTSISAINFLQYSDSQWAKYAANRYMYMNRLRHDDILDIYRSAGHHILVNKTDIDKKSAEILKTGRMQLDEKFKRKSEEILSITGSWIVSQYLSNERKAHD